LIEPFVGAGSVFLATGYEQYLLADANPVLMALYAQLQTDPQAVTTQAQALFVDSNRNQAAYNALRSRFNDPSTPELTRAALLVYLNKFAYNGLYRVNKKGVMNVAYTHHAKLPGFPLAAIERFTRKLTQAELHCADFEQTMAQAQGGDVLFCDPPYLESQNAQGMAGATLHSVQAYRSLAADTGARGQVGELVAVFGR
jgi:DNA adenine methylase